MGHQEPERPCVQELLQTGQMPRSSVSLVASLYKSVIHFVLSNCRYVGEGARMVRELFEMARTKKACIIFFDEIDAIGGARFDDGAGGGNEVQRTMLELITQLDGFDPRGNIKVMFATNRPSTLDPALLRPGRIDRKVEFSLPDVEGRTHILKIHAKRYEYFNGVVVMVV